MEAHKDGFLNAEIEALVRRELIRKEAQGEFRYDPETGDYHRVRKPEQE